MADAMGEPTGQTEEIGGTWPGSVGPWAAPEPSIELRRAPVAAPSSAESLLTQARARIAALDVEIARLEDCQRERAMLARMVEAAE